MNEHYKIENKNKTKIIVFSEFYFTFYITKLKYRLRYKNNKLSLSLNNEF